MHYFAKLLLQPSEVGNVFVSIPERGELPECMFEESRYLSVYRLQILRISHMGGAQ